MTVQLPEIEKLEKTVASLRREFNYFLNSSTNVKKTVTISDIAKMEGVSVSQLRKGGKERYLLPRFGVSGYPTGAVRWNISEYLDWRAIDPRERQQAYLESLRNRTIRAYNEKRA